MPNTLHIVVAKFLLALKLALLTNWQCFCKASDMDRLFLNLCLREWPNKVSLAHYNG